MTTSNRSSNFSHAELNVLVTSLEANRELALNEISGSVAVAERKKEWKILTDLINAVGGQNRTCQHVRQKWSDLKSRTKKKFSDLREQKLKSDGRPPNDLTDIEKRILKMIRPASESFSETWLPDILTQHESSYETRVAITHLKNPTHLDELDESSNQLDNSGNNLTFPIENCLSDDDQRPSTSQEERNMSDDPETDEPTLKQKLKHGSTKSLHFRINCHRNKKGSLLHEKIRNAIKTRNNINSTLTDIKSLLQESVKLQKQMLENQKLELMLLAKIADAELLYDD